MSTGSKIAAMIPPDEFKMVTVVTCLRESRWLPRSRVHRNQDGRHDAVSVVVQVAAMIPPDTIASKMAAASREVIRLKDGRPPTPPLTRLPPAPPLPHPRWTPVSVTASGPRWLPISHSFRFKMATEVTSPHPQGGHAGCSKAAMPIGHLGVTWCPPGP